MIVIVKQLIFYGVWVLEVIQWKRMSQIEYGKVGKRNKGYQLVCYFFQSRIFEKEEGGYEIFYLFIYLLDSYFFQVFYVRQNILFLGV